MRIRTGEEFDAWFSRTGGDPWGYSSSSVIRRRLRDSCRFLLRYVHASFSGIWLEIGAFDGSCTELLARTFKHSSIVANDISRVAISKAKEKVAQHENVDFHVGDLLNIRKQDLEPQGRDIVITLLECLYYLSEGERETAIVHLRQEFPMSPVFVSGPIVGGKYFTEEVLVKLFLSAGYVLRGLDVLNLRYRFPLPSPLIRTLCDRSAPCRQVLANQTIYAFFPATGSSA